MNNDNYPKNTLDKFSIKLLTLIVLRIWQHWYLMMYLLVYYYRWTYFSIFSWTFDYRFNTKCNNKHQPIRSPINYLIKQADYQIVKLILQTTKHLLIEQKSVLFILRDINLHINLSLVIQLLFIINVCTCLIPGL